MPVDERSRHQLFNHLDDVLGPEDAATLIEHLPPVGWADVATKRDLDALELRIDQRFVSVDHRFDQIDQRFVSIDQRFVSIDQRFEDQARSIDQRFDQMDQSIDERFVWFEEKFNLRLEAVKHELIAMFHRELNAQTKVIMFGMITIVLTMASLAFALVRFT
ncbi:MAG: hypothetical protein M3507_08090 [Actinomycetota bacterium]|jgi:hypothetical protein|nr:hypothetical protein [Actinomycetota bacterium]